MPESISAPLAAHNEVQVLSRDDQRHAVVYDAQLGALRALVAGARDTDSATREAA